MYYRPLLRWKRGEQTALANLADVQKARISPLLTISGHIYNPAPGQAVDPAFDARIVQDAERLALAWRGRRAAIDFQAVEPDAECNGGLHPLSQFSEAVNGNVTLSPVIRPDSDSRLIKATEELGSPPTFRLSPDDLALPDIAATLEHLIERCQTAPDKCDVVVDLGYVISPGRAVFTASGALAALPFMRDWASVTLACGSFPANLSSFSVGSHILERAEWALWQNMRRDLRPVVFGDYTTIHPSPVEEALDPRTMNPSASVRYTSGDKWLLLRGEGTRNRGGLGFAQFQHHAASLVRHPEFRGEDFSYGDTKIGRIARGEDNHGSLETWVTIGVNHHIAETVDQLSNLYGL